jgi:hypothetical protein
MAASEEFEARTEQAAHSGDDTVRFVQKVMKDYLTSLEAPNAILPRDTTIASALEVCLDVLSGVEVDKWNERPQPQRESLLFSGNPSERMQALRDGTIDPSAEDVSELLGDFMEAASYTDYWPGSYTLQQFGHWLSATGEFQGNKVAEVIW